MAQDKNEENFESINEPHLKDNHHNDSSIDISQWELSSSIQILYHGKIYKLPRDSTKQWPDVMKHTVSMKKRYGMVFLYQAHRKGSSVMTNNAHYFAFFDSIEKCRIFASTNDMDLNQIKALTTELWDLDKEFTTIRYANSFQVGLALTVEVHNDHRELHGTKRYLQALSSKQAQNWFHCLNGILMNETDSIPKKRMPRFDGDLELERDFNELDAVLQMEDL